MNDEAAQPERPNVNITLNRDGVAAPVHRAVVLAAESVGTCLRALDNDSCAEQEGWGGSFGYKFEGLNLPSDERRETFKNWVLARGFQELARGVRETLEEAWFYVQVWNWASRSVTTMGELQAKLDDTRSAASKLPFPRLMEQVSRELVEPMAFDAEFQTLQNVRNCLEHRGGRVAPKDIDPATGKLTLTLPRLQLFYEKDGKEFELPVGEVVDREAPEHKLQEGVAINVRRVSRTRAYDLGEAVSIGPEDFFEIAFACQMFGVDVATKLPGDPAADAGAQINA